MWIDLRKRKTKYFMAALTIMIAFGLIGSTFSGALFSGFMSDEHPVQQDDPQEITGKQIANLEKIRDEYVVRLEENSQDESALRGLANAESTLVVLYQEMEPPQMEKRRQSLEGALTAYTELTELCPEDGEARFDLAVIYAELEQWEKAAKEIEKLLETEPDNFEAYFYAGLFRKEMQDYEKARAHWKRVLELEPEPVIKELVENYLKEIK